MVPIPQGSGGVDSVLVFLCQPLNKPNFNADIYACGKKTKRREKWGPRPTGPLDLA